MAGIGDLTFDLYGYFFAIMSCLCQAAYLLLVEFQVLLWAWGGKKCGDTVGIMP